MSSNENKHEEPLVTTLIKDNIIPKAIKGVTAQRSYSLLTNISLNKELIMEILAKKSKVEENNIIIDSSLLSVESFFNYYQFLKDSLDFINLFSEDSYKQLLSLIGQYLKDQNCVKCEAIIKEAYKLCYDCKKIYHEKCVTSKSVKKWFCK
jgi:hypothetical protein